MILNDRSERDFFFPKKIEKLNFISKLKNQLHEGRYQTTEGLNSFDFYR